MTTKSDKLNLHADWKGMLKRRFRWRRFRYEYGRWCFRTDCCGNTISQRFEWEKKP